MCTGVYAISGNTDFWSDVQLTKDCGAIPYLLHKFYNYNSVMVTAKTKDENYPSLNRYVKGMKIDYLSENLSGIDAKIKYIRNNYKKMDLLILYGIYEQYFKIVEEYKALRPNGKVYIALDANLFWMDRMDWNTPKFINFLRQCNVIATSSRILQKYLITKWPFKIEYIPNAFYNYAHTDLNVDFSKKENIILTVGRLGTKQKNNEFLLDCFVRVSKKLPDWKLKLIGPITSSFREYVNVLLKNRPELKSRIIVTGEIKDKRKLMDEYKKAKIFILTSRYEGSPNVIAESLVSGCYNILSNFDTATEAIDDGSCGFVFENQKELTDGLVKVCNNSQTLLSGGKEAIKFANKDFDFRKVIRKLHYLLMLEG